MKKIAVIGGGIIGMTLANYLDSTKFTVTLYDDPLGQATKASAGIISPWLSKRRNRKWYRLAKEGAAFFPKLVADFLLDKTIYQQTGTLIVRPESALQELLNLAAERKKTAPEIGDIRLLKLDQTAKYLPLLKPQPALYVTGGGRLDGQAYLAQLQLLAQQKGVRIRNEKATLKQKSAAWQVSTSTSEDLFDFIALTPGPKLKGLLANLGYSVDLRPQKGQLLVFETDYIASETWPVAMLDGEADLIPFHKGKILIGATHENEAAWDLTPTRTAFEHLTKAATPFLNDAVALFAHPQYYQVGTRAYTADSAPFFGPLPELPQLVVASGLGSSGLTTGPYIGYQLARYFNTNSFDGTRYQKDLNQVISKDTSLINDIK
ncbi:NAD(P)/FAD-dependent oxidoreductase [Enterococcus faecalis]